MLPGPQTLAGVRLHLEKAFGFRQAVAKRVRGGTENRSYVIDTISGKYVISYLGKKDRLQAIEYVQYLLHLKQENFPVPTLVAGCDGGFLHFWNDTPAIMCTFIEGRQYRQLPARMLGGLGRLLGSLHQSGIDCTIPPQVRLSGFDLDEVKNVDDDEYRNWLQDGLEKYSYVLELGYEPVPTHGDLFPDNIIVAGDIANIIDWEDGSLDSPLIDIGMAIIGLCCTDRFDPSRFSEFWNGYANSGSKELNPQHILDTIQYLTRLIGFNRFRKSHHHLLLPGLRPYEEMPLVATSAAETWGQL